MREILKRTFKESIDYMVLNKIQIKKMKIPDLHNPDFVPFPETKIEIS